MLFSDIQTMIKIENRTKSLYQMLLDLNTIAYLKSKPRMEIQITEFFKVNDCWQVKNDIVND